MSPIIDSVIPHLIAILPVPVVEGICTWSEKDTVYRDSAIQVCPEGNDLIRMRSPTPPTPGTNAPVDWDYIIVNTMNS